MFIAIVGRWPLSTVIDLVGRYLAIDIDSVTRPQALIFFPLLCFKFSHPSADMAPCCNLSAEKSRFIFLTRPVFVGLHVSVHEPAQLLATYAF
jgi:hypothetical protein